MTMVAIQTQVDLGKVKHDIDRDMQLAAKVVDRFMSDHADLIKPALEILGKIKLDYHNYDHTVGMMKACVVIWSKENREDLGMLAGKELPQELKELLLAGSYHDIGQKDGAKGHEARGSEILAQSLKGKVEDQAIERMQSYIMATRMEMRDGKFVQVEVSDRNAKILQDADMFNLGGTDWLSQRVIGDAIFQETAPEELRGHGYSNSLGSIKFAVQLFKSHDYQTSSARNMLTPLKQENIRQLDLEALRLEFALATL